MAELYFPFNMPPEQYLTDDGKAKLRTLTKGQLQRFARTVKEVPHSPRESKLKEELLAEIELAISTAPERAPREHDKR